MPVITMLKGRPDDVENFDALDALPDVFEDEDIELTPAAVAAIDEYRAREMKAASAVVAADVADVKNEMRATGMSIAEYVATHAHDTEEEKALCNRMGWNYYTHDSENIDRMRAGKVKAAIARARAASNLKVAPKRSDLQPAKVETKPAKVAKVQTKPAPKPAPVVDDGLPLIPSDTSKPALEMWARDYCRALCERHQSIKLQNKLFGGPFNPGGGSLNWQIAAIPDNEGARHAWAASAKLSFDKKVGA